MDLLNTSSGTVTFESLTNLPSESALTTVGPDVAADDGWSVGKALVVVGYIIALIVLVGGNGLVLYSIASYRFLQNSANMFVAVLAGVDLTFGISVALKAVQVVDPTVFVGLFACQFKLILGISNCFASVLALFGKRWQYLLFIEHCRIFSIKPLPETMVIYHTYFIKNKHQWHFNQIKTLCFQENISKM